MFRIEVCTLPGNVDEVSTGLEALDIRRRLGLRDGSKLVNDGPLSKWVQVDEAFARLYFPRDAQDMRATVTMDMLVSGDLQDDKDDNSISWSETVTDERLKALFVAGEKETAPHA